MKYISKLPALIFALISVYGAFQIDGGFLSTLLIVCYTVIGFLYYEYQVLLHDVLYKDYPNLDKIIYRSDFNKKTYIITSLIFFAILYVFNIFLILR